jgi:hypothetical protein
MLPNTVGPEERATLEDIFHQFSAVQNQQAELEPEDLVMPSAPAMEPQEATAPKTVGGREGEEEEYLVGEEDQSTAAKISRGITIGTSWEVLCLCRNKLYIVHVYSVVLKVCLCSIESCYA